MLQRTCAVWKLQGQKIETAKCCLVERKIMYVFVGQWCVPLARLRLNRGIIRFLGLGGSGSSRN